MGEGHRRGERRRGGLRGIHPAVPAQPVASLAELEADALRARATAKAAADEALKAAADVANAPLEDMPAAAAKAQEAADRKKKNRLRKIEDEIESLQLQVAEIEDKLAQPDRYAAEIASGELYQAYEAAKKALEEKEMEWLELESEQ